MKFLKILVFVFLIGFVLVSVEKLVPSVFASSDNSQIEENKKFRAAFGLKSDDNYVNSVMKEKNSDTSFGVKLTPEAAAELNERIEIQNDVFPKLIEYMSTNPLYAGSYVNQSESGIGYILLAGPVNDYSTLNNELKKIHRGKLNVKIKKVKYSLEELEKYNKLVIESLNEKMVKFTYL